MEDIIIGINPILELVKAKPSRFIKVFCNRGSLKGRKLELIDKLRKKKIPLSYVDKTALYKKSGTDSHQGFVAVIAPRKFWTLDNFLASHKKKDLCLLMLDSIFDPQNTGAILRAAECFAVDGVIIPKGTNITPIVSKASAGAVDLVPLIQVPNAKVAITKCKSAKCTTICADNNPKASSLLDFTFPERTLLIVGSEGKGISAALVKQADFSVKIPMQGKIDSLNVSQATALILGFWQKALNS